MTDVGQLLDHDKLRRMARLHPTAWAIYASEGQWRNARHFDLLAEKVMAMRAGTLKRLCVSMPPGHGKSEYLSLYVASWWLGTRPQDRVILSSYGRDLAKGWSKRAKNLLGAFGEEVFGVTANTRESSEFWQPRGPDGEIQPGFFFPVGVGGDITGRRAEVLIFDDLIKSARQARSKSVRDDAWKFFDADAMTRLLPHSVVIMIGTRWHEDDPIGRLEEKNAAGDVEEPWEFINLPALAVEGVEDALGREPGEPLWPAMWPREALEKKRRGRDAYTWGALYQGRPRREGGGLFKEDWLVPYEVVGGVVVAGDLRIPLERLKRFATVDFAGSKSTRADNTSISTFGIDHETRSLVLLDQVAKKLEAPAILSELRDVQERQRPTSFYAEETGPALNQVHRLRLAEAAGEKIDPKDKAQDVLISKAISAGIPIKKLKADRDKVSRSGPAQAVMAEGKLLTPAAAPWLAAWKDEVFSFDGTPGDPDDQVDTLSYGVQVFLEVLQASAWASRRKPDAQQAKVVGQLVER